MPFSLANVVNNPRFAQAFTITRSQGGRFILGVWTDADITVQGFGVVQPATAEELEMIPDGDRVKGALSFHSAAPLYETNVSPTSMGISDVISWNNQTYRLVKVFPWQDFGYYKAIGLRMSGQ